MPEQQEWRHECRRSGDFENIAREQGFVRAELKNIDTGISNLRADIGKIFTKIDGIVSLPKQGGGKWETLIKGAIATLIITVAAYVGSLIKGM